MRSGPDFPPAGDELRLDSTFRWSTRTKDRSALEIKVLLEAVHAPDRADPGQRS